MKRLLILAIALVCATFSFIPACAGVGEGEFAPQFTAGLTTSITPEFRMMPTLGVRVWFTVAGRAFALEASAFSSKAVAFDSTANTGWSGAAMMKVRTFDYGSTGSLHVIAHGGFQTEADGTWKMDFSGAQYNAGLAFPIEPWARSTGQLKGVAFEPGIYYMAADGVVNRLGVTAKAVLDF